MSRRHLIKQAAAASRSTRPLFSPNFLVRFLQPHKNSIQSLSPLCSNLCHPRTTHSRFLARTSASVAEAIASSDVDEYAEEIHEKTNGEEMIKTEVRDRGRDKVKVRFRFDDSNPKPWECMGEGRYYTLRKRQLKAETEAWEDATTEYQELLSDMCEQNLAPNLPYIKTLFLGWFQPLRDAISVDQVAIRGDRRFNIASHFDLVPPDKMAVITMHKLMGLMMTDGAGGGVRVVRAALTVGEAIEKEARILRFLKSTKKKATSGTVQKESDSVYKEQEKLRKKVTKLMKKQKLQQVNAIVKGWDDSKPWGQEDHARIGGRLIHLLLEKAYIQAPVNQIDDSPPDIRPAFIHTIKTVGNETKSGTKRYGIIESDPIIRKGLERTARHVMIPYMPMLIPPLNWTGYDRGAYLFLPSCIMRPQGNKKQRLAFKRASKKQLKPIYEALDTLGSTKWRVNKKVLSVIDRIWASGGHLADLVNREDIPMPEAPDAEDLAEIRKWKWKVKDVKKENMERHSQRCEIELKLAVAQKMKDEDGFFYPHNIDFRGRAYPMHPHLNHLGSDVCRGILEFGEGRPLGKSGLRWLKIHLANIYAGGVDKLSFEGRVAFTENHLDDVFDSADRPLEGKRWWLNAEDPFQCLAVCMNLSEALRSSSPETTISYVPVHQDGSCNGLQHYAALGRDKLGAAAVNLIAGEKPADVYSGIAIRVIDIMRKDAAKDPATHPDAMLAQLLVNQVDRKLVKQTVMTSVYGVTYIGARDQIKRRLKERCAINEETLLFRAACYAAKTTLTALEEMFEAARSIMSWLGDCAKIIALANQPVRWTTSIGLPVVQPYYKMRKRIVMTSLQSLSLTMETDMVMVRRQKTAFPPNFVHSLDGSHMMMTAIACRKAGLYFAGVHDSYWTHACHVEELNKILREKFVELYEAPILENLLESFERSFPKLQFPPLPPRGDFDLREVLKSPYFFN